MCDFLGYVHPLLFLIECKTTKTNTLPLKRLTQCEKMKAHMGKRGVRVGFVVWFQTRDLCAYVPLFSVLALREQGAKSINVKDILSGEVTSVVVPSRKKRVFLDCDYSCLCEL